MTEQEFIKIRDKVCYSQEWCKDGFCKDTEESPCCIQLMLDALEKQIPKKVLISNSEYKWMLCPACRSILSKGQKGFETPCRCGQILDWMED